jgi:hypothetical protein
MVPSPVPRALDSYWHPLRLAQNLRFQEALSAGGVAREIDTDGGIESLNDRDQVVHIVIGKQPFHPLLMEARKGFFVELAGVHDALLGEQVNDLLDEPDLVGSQGFAL